VRSPVPYLAALTALAVAGGCALTQRSKPVEFTYYTPELVRTGVASRQAASSGRPTLRLGRVGSGVDLGPRIAFGDGAYQVHYYDDRRWTERPENYVRRALARALFVDGGFRTTSGDAPTLDVEVLAFEEIRAPEQHAARIALRLVLSKDHVLIEEDTVAVTQPVAGESFDEVVAAMASALDQSSREAARRVGSALEERAPGSSSPGSSSPR
jgi:cholesterol transport system auxiliary component